MKKKIQNILFIEVKSPFNHIFSRSTIPRLGSVLLATILKEHGYNARVIIEDVKMFDVSMLKGVDMVGLSTITSTAPRAFDIAELCRKNGIPTVIGGPHVTFLPDEALDYTDYVVRGEGEKAITQLINALNEDKPLDDIMGLSYKKDNKIFHNEKEDFVKDLDALPIPDFSLVDGWTSNKIIPISTSRGCPFKCKFCSVIKMFGTSMRYHSVDRVLEELRRYSGKVKHIFFCDDNFTANKSRAKQILNRMIDEKIKVEWSAQVRVDAARDEELMALMRKAGCFTVYIGFESINPKTLLAYDKKQSFDDIKIAIDTFHKFNIKIHGMFVLGASDDNVFTVRDTAKFAKSMRLDSIQFLILTPLPGTETYYEMEAKGSLISKDWKLYDSHHVVFKPESMSPYELQTETLKAMRSFYSLRGGLRELLNRNLLYFFVHLYGIHSIRKSFKDNIQFIANLKKAKNNEVKKIKDYLSPAAKKIKHVIIPENVFSKNEEKIFSQFLKNIGIKVEFVKTKLKDPDFKEDVATYVKSEMRNLKDKAALIVVAPVTEKYSESVEPFLQDFKKMALSNIKNVKLVPADMINKDIYNFCINFGLALDKKMKKVNKAYFSALERAQEACDKKGMRYN